MQAGNEVGMRGLTPWQLLCIYRLETALKQEHDFAFLERNSHGSKLIKKAVYSLYLDCCNAGLQEQADKMLKGCE
jgi:hypothetical protein